MCNMCNNINVCVLMCNINNVNILILLMNK